MTERERERERDRDRDRDRQTDSRIDRETDRQTDRQRQRETERQRNSERKAERETERKGVGNNRLFSCVLVLARLSMGDLSVHPSVCLTHKSDGVQTSDAFWRSARVLVSK